MIARVVIETLQIKFLLSTVTVQDLLPEFVQYSTVTWPSWSITLYSSHCNGSSSSPPAVLDATTEPTPHSACTAGTKMKANYSHQSQISRNTAVVGGQRKSLVPTAVGGGHASYMYHLALAIAREFTCYGTPEELRAS